MAAHTLTVHFNQSDAQIVARFIGEDKATVCALVSYGVDDLFLFFRSAAAFGEFCNRLMAARDSLAEQSDPFRHGGASTYDGGIDLSDDAASDPIPTE